MPKMDKKLVYALTRQVPKGRVTTYGALARAAGNSQGARGVGMLMSVNPDAPRTPCHRVVYWDGSLGGYSSPEGLEQKISRLGREGVRVVDGRIADFSTRYFDDFERKV